MTIGSVARFSASVARLGSLTTLAVGIIALQGYGQSRSEIIVPGTGIQLKQVGDDFEDEAWEYIPRDPKSTEDIDENQRMPMGKSTNGRWYEGAKRGHPDVVKRVPTPPGGIPGSEGSLLMRSLFTGIPNRPSRKMHQDDFICNVQYRLGGTLKVSQTPNITTRVFIPPLDEWENRNGPHFAFRAAVETRVAEKKQVLFFTNNSEKDEVYWPGLFILRGTRQVEGRMVPYAYFRVRADRSGGDFMGPEIPETGWWTLGLTFTPDGLVHYFARQGVDELTRDDYIATAMPYGYRCEELRSFFYNVVNGDNGRDWSTDWIVDDPKLYVVQSPRVANRK
ncbi:MAG: hypothetical protein MUF23_03320 [Pirellula sp.]|jgi:hypothetical protein|nr:hypothetical protein [Pirellula sp.]